MLWLLVMPSRQVVVALTVEVASSHREAIRLLEDCYYHDLTVESARIDERAAAEAARAGVPVAAAELSSECHQLVFSKRLRERNQPDLLQRLVYRADLPYLPEFSTISYPAELNRRPNTTAAIGPYVSVLCGQQDYVENAAFASAVQAVGSAVRLREISDTAYQELRQFSEASPSGPDTRARRRRLGQLADGLTRLELELSGSVEVPADLGVVVPSLRAVAYHQQVYAAMGLRERSATVSQALRRLDAAARAELTAIESIERRADENRRLRWAVAIGFVSVVAIPISLVLAFFGINASQVDSERSMFDPIYAWVYAGVGLLAVVSVLLALTVYAHQIRHHHLADAPAVRRAAAAVQSGAH